VNTPVIDSDVYAKPLREISTMSFDDSGGSTVLAIKTNLSRFPTRFPTYVPVSTRFRGPVVIIRPHSGHLPEVFPVRLYPHSAQR
jgi:hypothetical protein